MHTLHVVDETDNASNTVVKIATTWRSSGLTVDHVLETRKIKWVMSHANKSCAKALVLVDSEGHAVVKDMSNGKQNDFASIQEVLLAVQDVVDEWDED